MQYGTFPQSGDHSPDRGISRLGDIHPNREIEIKSSFSARIQSGDWTIKSIFIILAR